MTIGIERFGHIINIMYSKLSRKVSDSFQPIIVVLLRLKVKY